MRKLSFLTGIILITVSQAFGQAWYSLGPNDNNQPSYYSAARTSVAADQNGNVYIAYIDAGRNNKITVEKYASGIWSIVGNAGFSASAAEYVDIAVTADGIPYIVYQKDDGSDPYAYDATVMRYASGSWGIVGVDGFSRQFAFNNGFPDFSPNIDIAIAPDNTPYVAYQDYDATNQLAATVKKFDGTNWVTVGSQGFTGNFSAHAIALSFTIAKDGTPFIFFKDDGPNPSVASSGTVMKFDGSNWFLVGTEGFTNSEIAYPSIAIASDGNPYVAYKDITRTGKASVMLFNGSNWINIGPSGFTVGGVDYVSLGIDSTDKPYIGYKDLANSNKATVQKFDGTSWSGLGSASISDGAAQYTNLLIDSLGKIYLIYSDGVDNSKAIVKRFDDPAWVTVGSKGISGGTASNTSLAVNNSNEVFVAYKDNLYGGRVSVAKYASSTWSVVSSPGFSAGTADYISLSINPINGRPYVAYQDGSTSGKLSVSYLADDGWASLGSTGFTSGTASSVSFAFSSSGTPYVAFSDGANGDRLSVMTYNGSAWVNVGTAGFSTGNVVYTSIAIAPDGSPFVAYYDLVNGKATVRKFNSSSWISVGSSGGISTGVANYISLSTASDGTPFIAYQNGANGKAIVQSFNGTTWSVVGAPDFSTGAATHISLRLDNANSPLVAYQDAASSNKLTLKQYLSGSWNTLGTEGVSAGTASDVSMGIANGTVYIAYTDGYAWVKAFGSVALPVKLVNFSATKQQATVLLQWQTESEVNSNYFIIEHGTNGNGFSEIGRIYTGNNSNQLKNYSFIHKDPKAGKNYYRLRQIDLDGKTTTYPVRIVNFGTNELAYVAIYPNPVQDKLFIKSNAGANAIVITNSLGQTVLRQKVNSNQQNLEMDVSRLAKGYYHLTLVFTDGQKTMEFIKN